MSDKRRPGSRSDEDRALEALQRRRVVTPVRGVPVADDAGSFEEDDHFTPVSEVIERAADLTDRERTLLRYVWTHTANMEMRTRRRSDSQETSTLAKRIDELETAVVDIRGEHGDNGKVGELRRRVDTFIGRSWAIVLLLLGGIAGAAIKLVIVGRSYGELETQVENARARVQLLERVVFLKSLPATQPEKEPTP